jgi:hypothetical protein
MSLERLPDLYYTAEQARKKLGMTKDAFNHYVKTGVIKKTTIVGKHGHFMKREIDMLAHSINAAMLAAQESEIQFKKATLQDQEKELELAVLNFGEPTKRFHEYRRQLLTINPDIAYYVYDHEHMVASIDIVPLEHEGILKFKEGERGWLLGEYVKQFVSDEPLEIIIIDMMTTTLVPMDKRNRYAMHLLFGMVRVLEEWGKQGVDIQKIYANGGSIYGRRLLETAGFTKLGERKDNRVIYELDLKDSRLQVVRPYKEAISEYKARTSQK